MSGLEYNHGHNRSLLTELLQFALITAFIIIPFRIFVAQPFVVNGSSMDTTFADRQYLIVDQISYRFKNPNRGEVVVFHPLSDESKYYIKRTIGLPGETIKIKEGNVTIKNSEHPEGFSLPEPYVTFTKNDNLEITLSEDEYFMMGDNRAASFDSRDWGPLPRDLIIGRPVVRLLPAQKLSVWPGDYSLP